MTHRLVLCLSTLPPPFSHCGEILTGIEHMFYTDTILCLGSAGVKECREVNGCWLAASDGVRHVVGFKVDAIDSNGAGDTHDGAFIAALLAGAGPTDAATIANRTA